MKRREVDALINLANLIHNRNKIAEEISLIIDRPAQIGHIGEFIASKIFQITLAESASEKAIDGYFSSGTLQGKSVNIKWYAKRENMLDITPDGLPDYYLVMTGPKSPATSSKGQVRPWVINSVYLFQTKSLMSKLVERRIKIGIATSIKEDYWINAEIYPDNNNGLLMVNQDQRNLLKMYD